jgi:hypothetical protein
MIKRAIFPMHSSISNHGNCTQSIGLCACDERYTGVRCDACKPPYYDYANGCKQVPTSSNRCVCVCVCVCVHVCV